MFRLPILALCILFSFQIFSQDREVKWYFSFNERNSEIEMKAEIAKGWHLYSQVVDENAGPVATEFEFIANEKFSLVGVVSEPSSIKAYDENFEATLNYFENQVVFKQKVKSKSRTNIAGSVLYMVCNETMCLPPIVEEFSIEIHP